jgi:hypothetical protein
MDASEILSKIIQQEIDKEVLSELFDVANVPKEEYYLHSKKMNERQSTELARIIHDMTNENIHKLKG